jgi:hypothetical protein
MANIRVTAAVAPVAFAVAANFTVLYCSQTRGGR